ncbi:hypothetical protein PENTCL1PPCAC_19469, partial [Pristionchus entomophagus]
DTTQVVPCDNEIPHSDFMGDEMPLMDEITGNEQESLEDEPIETREEEETGGNIADVREDPGETVEVEKRKRSTRNTSRHQKYTESMDNSEGEEGPSVKKARSDFAKKGAKATPQCILCEVFPTTAISYADHLNNTHKTTLKSNGIYLICSCGKEVRSHNRDPNHSNDCGGVKFTLHKLSAPTTPKCVLCEAYPTTTRGYTEHLLKHHQTTLKS